ncbi:MAG: ATP-binding protein [Bacteroidetes bacterium]|nr:MAG: ATP-binding protein [Bacteroidota bacterium]
MIQRKSAERLIKLAASFRSVAVVGPRQSGKTTLCRKCFPSKPYVSLENPDTLAYSLADPRGFLGQYPQGAILDEVQKAPHLFSYIQQILDETKKRGLFILTGSNNFLLQENITQTLAGRVAYMQLLPLSLQELQEGKQLKANYTWHIFNGGYPEQITRKIAATDWYHAYINTYIERDVRQLKNISNLATFSRFLKLCAGRTGQILNLANLGNDCGIDAKTAAAWLSLLESSYIIYLLKPYYENYNKRNIKSPKLYFVDTGLACALLGITEAKQISTHAAKGALFENLAVSNLLKNRFNAGKESNLYYWRDKTGNEIDILLDDVKQITTVEIKAGETIAADYFKGLHYFDKITTKKTNSILLYGGKEEQKRSDGTRVCSWQALVNL